jgi:hypothetical protein
MAKNTKGQRVTQIEMSGHDLSVMARLMAAGQVVLPTKDPVIARLKRAMTRMGVPVPKGL